VFGSNREVTFALTSGGARALGFRLQQPAPGVPARLPFGLHARAYGFGGVFAVQEAFGDLRNRGFEINTVMLVAATGAAALSAWAEGALLLFRFNTGRALWNYALGREGQADQKGAARG